MALAANSGFRHNLGTGKSLSFVTACTLALSPYFVTRFTRRLQPFRYLHDCSGCLPAGAFAGWGFHPLESAALSRRTPDADIRVSGKRAFNAAYIGARVNPYQLLFIRKTARS